MSDTELLPYLRQYRHNDGSDGLVFGYEKEGVDRLVAMLRSQIAALKPVGMVRHFVYEGIARNGPSIEAQLFDGIDLPDSTVLYAEPKTP